MGDTKPGASPAAPTTCGQSHEAAPLWFSHLLRKFTSEDSRNTALLTSRHGTPTYLPLPALRIISSA